MNVSYELKIKYHDGKSKIFQQNLKIFSGVPPIFKNQKKSQPYQYDCQIKAYELKIKYHDGKSKIFNKFLKNFQGVPPIFKN